MPAYIVNHQYHGLRTVTDRPPSSLQFPSAAGISSPPDVPPSAAVGAPPVGTYLLYGQSEHPAVGTYDDHQSMYSLQHGAMVFYHSHSRVTYSVSPPPQTTGLAGVSSVSHQAPLRPATAYSASTAAFPTCRGSEPLSVSGDRSMTCSDKPGEPASMSYPQLYQVCR